MRRRWMAMIMVAGMIGAGSSFGAVKLVENGEPKAVLVLPDEPIEQEKAAAEEIQDYIKRISGAELTIVNQAGASKGQTRIWIGRAAPKDVVQALQAKTDDLNALAVFVGKGQISLTGIVKEEAVAREKKIREQIEALQAAKKRLPRGLQLEKTGGVLFAAYELLEQIGVRWFMPGEIGTVVPSLKTVQVEEQQTIQVPALVSRHLQAISPSGSSALGNQWEDHMRCGGPRFPSAHGAPGVAHGAKLLEEHPEWGSLVNGKRTGRQLCISNPEVVAAVTEATRKYFQSNPDAPWMGMGANDGRGFCECPNCKALDGGDYDPFGKFESMTDRYVWFFNQILAGIEKEFPDKKISFYAYSVYNRPPVKTKPNPRIVPAVALITLCRMHELGNPICPEKDYERWIISSWCEQVPEVFWRGYWFNLADPGLPYFFVDRVRKEVPAFKNAGLVGIRCEAPPNWAGGSAPSLYIACKLMWNEKADVDALMTDFYEKFFGPAAAPMRRYMEAVEQARVTGDFHTGCSWDFPLMYGPEVRKTARESLAQARKLATQEPYSLRVEGYSKGWQFFEDFAEMMEKRTVHDYVAAHAALERALDVVKYLKTPLAYGGLDTAKTGYFMPSHYKAEEYMKRFFSQSITDGYAKVTAGNEFVVGLADEWDFMIDPEQVGVEIKLFDPQFRGGNWEKLKTSSTSWSTQGLRYYKGWAWYRQTVQIPEEFKGKKVFLWVGGVDESATVWVNGQGVGNSPRGTFKAFDLDATPAIKFGGQNTVTVLLQNMAIQEIGTGGITGSAMFYAPADPEAKPTGLAFAVPAPTPMVPLASVVPAAVVAATPKAGADEKPQDMETIGETDKPAKK